MKKMISIVLSLLLCFTFCSPAFALENPALNTTPFTYSEADLGDGFAVKDELIVYETARSFSKSAAKTRSISFGGATVATITLHGTFVYNGSTVSVASKSVTKTLQDGWTYTQNSLTSSGGTITLHGTVSKSIYKASFTLTLTCDKNGNVS